MQFGMLRQVGPGNMYYMGCGCHRRHGHFWGVWPIEKHCKAYKFGNWVEGWAVQKTICALYDVYFHKELPFVGHVRCTCIKIFSGVNF